MNRSAGWVLLHQSGLDSSVENINSQNTTSSRTELPQARHNQNRHPVENSTRIMIMKDSVLKPSYKDLVQYILW